MWDIPGAPILEKSDLVGGCLRLPLHIDAGRLAAEVGTLDDSLWGSQGGRVGVQRQAQAVFLRGYAPAEGEKPLVERPPLGLMPYVRWLITTLIPAPAQRCLLARLPAGATIAPHIDRAPYFSKTLRLHMPVATHDSAWMVANGLVYRMEAGEVWALNNSTEHAVWNAHPTLARTHLICDFLPTPELLRLLSEGARDEGVTLAPVLERLFG